MSRVSKILMCALFMSGLAHAQTPINWGDQADLAREKYVLFVDNVKAGKYLEAIEPHEWLLDNTPDLSASLYQYGARVYEGLAEKESDLEKQAAYQSLALQMYDARITYFGEEAYVLNRKVIPAYKFYRKDKSRYQELYELFSRAFELNGNDFFDNNLVAYMDVVRRHKLTSRDLSDEKVIEIYTSIIDVIDHKKGLSNDHTKLDRIADQVDKVFAGTIDMNCDFVESILGPKFQETQDIKLARKIFQLMLKGKCTERPLAFEVAKLINERDPSFGIAKFLGQRATQQGDLESASTFFNQAIALTQDNLKKTEVYLSLAKMDAQEGQRVSARRNARKALAFDPSSKEAYTLIGHLYAQSFEDCKKGEKKTHDYAIFIAAHKMFELAGDVENAVNISQYFPTMQDIFNDEYQEGQIYEVGCWINESVKLIRRPD